MLAQWGIFQGLRARNGDQKQGAEDGSSWDHSYNCDACSEIRPPVSVDRVSTDEHIRRGNSIENESLKSKIEAAVRRLPVRERVVVEKVMREEKIDTYDHAKYLMALKRLRLYLRKELGDYR